MFTTLNPLLNMCEHCSDAAIVCPAQMEDVIFGNGNDNVVSCPFYQGPADDEISEIITVEG